MKIQVFSQKELVNHIAEKKDLLSHCISIVNPGNPTHPEDPSHDTPQSILEAFSEVLILRFWDSDSEALLHPRSTDMTIPNPSHIESIIDFVERTKDHSTGYTIHCWQGISRSTAVAFGILYHFLRDENRAAEKLIEIRRQAMPLKRILELFDDYFVSKLSNLHETIYRARLIELQREMTLGWEEIPPKYLTK